MAAIERGPAVGGTRRRWWAVAAASGGVVLALAAVLRLAGGTGEARARTPLPADPAVREADLVGRRLVDSHDEAQLERARREFERVLASEPDFAPALTRLPWTRGEFWMSPP